jgi:hypothetical protein
MSKSQEKQNEVRVPEYGLTRTESARFRQEEVGIASLIGTNFKEGIIPFRFIQGSIEIAGPLTVRQFQEIVMTYESKRFEVAKQIVRSLLKNLEYAELYQDFLQEGISEEEFKLESERYAVESRAIDPRQLQFEAFVAFDLSGNESMDADQLSMMLGTDPLETDSIIRGRVQPIPAAR